MPHHPIDPESLPPLVAFRGAANPDASVPTIEQRRAALGVIEAQMAAAIPVPDGVRIEERNVPGPEGAPERVFMYSDDCHVISVA